MTIHEQLAQEIQALPDEMAEEVLNFVEFVRTRNGRHRDGQTTYPSRIDDKKYAALREKLKDDPIIGMFNGSSNLATDSEVILEEGFGHEG